MSERKPRREIDKAIKHLMDYTGPNHEWAGRWDQVQDELLGPLAEKLEVSVDELEAFFYSGPYSHMVIGFGFEEYATAIWDNEQHNLIEAYLAHRGWREGSAGRRYLRALGESELGFWEITAIKPGAYAEIRPYGTQDESIRVKEKGVLGILPPNTAKTAEAPVFTGLQATINFNLAQVSVSSSAFGSKNEQKQATIDSHCR